MLELAVEGFCKILSSRVELLRVYSARHLEISAYISLARVQANLSPFFHEDGVHTHIITPFPMLNHAALGDHCIIKAKV